MGKKLLRVIGISTSQSQTGAYALILNEIGSNRRIPIIIGSHEAQSIAIQLENLKPSRPLTHDLFKSFADSTGVVITEVTINKFVEGVFHSSIVCVKGGEIIVLDSRTSDAVAIALRFECPIYAEEDVIEKTAIEMDEAEQDFGDDEDDEDDFEDDDIHEEELKEVHLSQDINIDSLKKLNLADLQELLMHYVETEQYEMASKVRDEINSRK